MRIPTRVSEFLIQHKRMNRDELSAKVAHTFGLNISPRKITHHLTYKGENISVRGDTYMDVPTEIVDLYPEYYCVIKKGVWVLRSLHGTENYGTSKLLSKALLEARHGITFNRHDSVIHLNNDISDMSDGNIIAVPKSVYSRCRNNKVDFFSADVDSKKLMLALAWSNHLLSLTNKLRKETRDDIRSEITRQIQSDSYIYSLFQSATRIDSVVV